MRLRYCCLPTTTTTATIGQSQSQTFNTRFNGRRVWESIAFVLDVLRKCDRTNMSLCCVVVGFCLLRNIVLSLGEHNKTTDEAKHKMSACAPAAHVGPISFHTDCITVGEIYQENHQVDNEVLLEYTSLARCRSSGRHNLHAMSKGNCSTQKRHRHLSVLDHKQYKERLRCLAEGLQATCGSNGSQVLVEEYGCPSAAFCHLAHQRLVPRSLVGHVDSGQ